MTEPPPPKRFQIHLSTAIVLMFVAGGMTWANTIPIKETRRAVQNVNTNYRDYVYDTYGVPFIMKRVRLTAPVVAPRDDFTYEYDNFLFNTFFAVINAAFALIILAVVWFVSEWLIRRRAARKGS